MKILLIEDEKKCSAFVQRGLENERCIVETAFNGTTGLKMAHHPSFDLMLPGVDGLTLLRESEV